MIELSINKNDLKELYKRLDSVNIKKRDSLLLRAFRQASAVVEKKLKFNASGSILKRRSGHLAQSIESSVYQDGEGVITARIGSGVRSGFRMPYTEIHETGGVITPRRVKYLTIPLAAALSPSGVPRKRSAADWPNTFVRRTKSGALIIFQRTGKKTSVPLYVLKRSVNVPARRYMSRTLDATKNYFIMAVRGAIERGLSGEQA